MIQPSILRTMSFCCLLAISVSLVPVTFAQGQPAAARNKDLTKIDAKAAKVDELFIRNAFDIAAEYEKAGDVARAVDYLHAMSLIKPGLAKIEARLQQLREQVLAANDFTFEFEPATNWGKPVAFVRSGKPFKINVQGGYKLAISALVGADGLAEEDIQSDLIDDVPLGKLVGVIVEKPNRPSLKGEEKIVPFEIGTGRVMEPRQDGYLFLKVNMPPQSKTSGSLQVQLSGYVLAPDGENIGN